MTPHAHPFTAAVRPRLITLALLAAVGAPSCALSQVVVGDGNYPVSTGTSDVNRPARSADKGKSYRGGIADALVHIDPGFRVDSGFCLGVGELGFLHFNKSGTQNVIQLRFDSPLVLQVIDVIGQRGAWLQLHAEPREPQGASHDKDVGSALALWTARQPRLKIMMSHTGMTSPANAKKLLASYPNLYFSIKLMSSRVGAWSHLEPLLNGEGDLYDDWATLMETMPSRFVVGSDAKFGQSGHEKEGEEGYEHTIRKFRRMLGSLDANAARQIASENVKRIYGFGKDATDAESEP
jgi:hypothetical protein